MRYVVLPGIGIENLRLGESSQEIEHALGTADDHFFRNQFSNHKTLAFDRLGLHIELNNKGEASRISVFVPHEATLMGVQLLGRSLHEIRDELDAKGILTTSSGVGLLCPDHGIHIVEVENKSDGVEVYAP